MAIIDRYVTSAGSDTYASSTNPATPMSLTTAASSVVAGDRINVKADGTYVRTASLSQTNGGTITSPIIWRGYKNTPGDGYLGRASGNGPLITTNMPLIAFNATFGITSTTAIFTIWESLQITASITSGAMVLASDSILKSSTIVNSFNSVNAACIASGGSSRECAFDCDLTQTSGNISVPVITWNNTTFRAIANRIKGGGITGSATATAFVAGNLISGCGSGSSAVSLSATAALVYVMFNTITGNGSDGVRFTASTAPLAIIFGNMITDNAGYGINWQGAAGAGMTAFNRFRDNVLGNTNLGTDWTAATNWGNVTTDTGGPETDYVNAAANDYNLIAASLGKGAGWFPYADLGALQMVPPSAGGAFHVLGDFIIRPAN